MRVHYQVSRPPRKDKGNRAEGAKSQSDGKKPVPESISGAGKEKERLGTKSSKNYPAILASVAAGAVPADWVRNSYC